MQEPRVEYITWLDSCHATQQGWNHRNELQEFIEEDAVKCATAGFIIEEYPTHIVIAQSYTEQGYLGNLIKIPKINILERKELV